MSCPISSFPDRWHIFCRVVDNYGDIGVCWRLARQLVHQHSLQVTLWVDDLASFQRLCPAVDSVSSQQYVAVEGGSVEVCHWQSDFVWYAADEQIDVVIEAFACDLPEAVLARLTATPVPPLWINLEYLSAEDWVPGFHLAPSPVNGLLKYFFFPGFMEGTGGLLFEPYLPGLPAVVRAESEAFFTGLGLNSELAQQELTISLFAYENPGLASLLDVLSQYWLSVHLLVPEGRISGDVAAWLGLPLKAGESAVRGSLTISALPFVSQEEYDRILAFCDLNFVRGEESFVRSQMLGRPTIWHIYHQEEGVHLEKLEAFLRLYLQPLQTAAGAGDWQASELDGLLAERIRAVSRFWNGRPGVPVPDWDGLVGQLPRWQQHAIEWQSHCLKLGDLAGNLVKLRENTRGNRL